MKFEHVEKQLSKFPWSIIFKLEHKLKKWQTNIPNIGNDLNNYSNPIDVSMCSLNKSITEKPQISHKTTHEFKVDEVLNSAVQGSLILDYYKKYDKINDVTLVESLIGHVLPQKIPISVSLAESIADQIVVMFRSELKVNYIDYLKIITI
jgi:hypothetical protein